MGTPSVRGYPASIPTLRPILPILPLAVLALVGCRESVDHVRWHELTPAEQEEFACVESFSWARETLTVEEYRHAWCLFKATYFNDECAGVYAACMEGDTVPPEECVIPDPECSFTLEQYENKMREMYEIFGEYQSLSCEDDPEGFEDYVEPFDSILPFWVCV